MPGVVFAIRQNLHLFPPRFTLTRMETITPTPPTPQALRPRGFRKRQLSGLPRCGGRIRSASEMLRRKCKESFIWRPSLGDLLCSEDCVCETGVLRADNSPPNSFIALLAGSSRLITGAAGHRGWPALCCTGQCHRSLALPLELAAQRWVAQQPIAASASPAHRECRVASLSSHRRNTVCYSLPSPR